MPISCSPRKYHTRPPASAHGWLCADRVRRCDRLPIPLLPALAAREQFSVGVNKNDSSGRGPQQAFRLVNAREDRAKTLIVPSRQAAVVHADPERAPLIDHQPGHAPLQEERGGVGGVVADKPDAIKPQHAAKESADPQISLRAFAPHPSPNLRSSRHPRPRL